MYIRKINTYKDKDMKQTIRLNESELKRMIAESVRRVLRESTRPRKRIGRRINEGGHLYHKDEDGKVWTNSKKTYRGVPGSVYIWHGAWNDPEVIWKGQSLNVYDIEDGMWSTYKDECEENGEQPTDNGFDAWVEAQGTDWIASQLDDLVWAAQGCP